MIRIIFPMAIGILIGVAMSSCPLPRVTFTGDWGSGVVTDNGRFVAGKFSTSPKCNASVLINGNVSWKIDGK